MPETKNNHDNARPQEAEPVFRIAIAGQGPMLHRLGKIISCRAFKSAMPDVKLAALLLKEGELMPEFTEPGLRELPIYKGREALF